MNLDEINLKLDEKKAKDLHFVLKHDLISGLLPSDRVKSISEINEELEKELKLERENTIGKND